MSDENGLPLLQPPQQTFPRQDVQVTPQGALITVTLVPGTGWFTTLGEQTMIDMMKLWAQTRKDIADQMRIIEHVKRTKNN